jgi:hypothetical protein
MTRPGRAPRALRTLRWTAVGHLWGGKAVGHMAGVVLRIRTRLTVHLILLRRASV